MKKILMAYGDTDFPQGSFEFIRGLNKLMPLWVTGIFLPQYDLYHLWLFSDQVYGQSFIPELADFDMGVRENNLKQFNDLFQKEGIECNVHDATTGITSLTLKKETRFADVMIIDSEKFYNYMGTGISNPSLKDTLHEAECPVIIVPDRVTLPERNIIAYDGSQASVFAIKQFSYLFPELCDHETIVVYLGDDNSSELPDDLYLKELVKRHFKNCKFEKLRGNSRNDFTKWVTDGKNALIISGSFGKSWPSLFFHKSFISNLITEHKLPVFIAHK